MRSLAALCAPGGHRGRLGLGTLLGIALLVWSTLPAFTHGQMVFETIPDHLDMVEDQGPSHGFEEELFWAMHGHSHDVADHDHSQAHLQYHSSPAPLWRMSSATWRLTIRDGPNRHIPIERPPRL